MKIGFYSEDLEAVYCGEFRDKKVWCSLHDAPEQMNWEEAKEWCVKQGGILPDIDTLTWVYLNQNEVNKALEAHGGKAFKENDWYWSSSEYNNNFSWLLYMSNGYRSSNGKSLTAYVRSFQLL